MHKIIQHNFLTYDLRRKVDHLIHAVWSQEAKLSDDVKMLVAKGDTVVDELDLLSTHVLLFKKPSQLIGYGRISWLPTISLPMETLQSTQMLTEGTTAYISRLVVHPNFQGLGLAQVIHNRRLEIARAWGADRVVGWAIGEKAKKNLTYLGFRPLHLKEGFQCAWYQTTRQALFMSLEFQELAIRHLPRVAP